MTSEEEFRAVMRNLAGAVTIITTAVKGSYHGTTATSFNSVSIDPLLVQVSLDLSSRTRRALKQSGMFAINILAADQEPIARNFALLDVDRFEGCDIEIGASGLPLIAGALGHIECKVVDEYPGGDHTIFLGEVLRASSRDGEPLIYFDGNYRRLADH